MKIFIQPPGQWFARTHRAKNVSYCIKLGVYSFQWRIFDNYGSRVSAKTNCSLKVPVLSGLQLKNLVRTPNLPKKEKEADNINLRGSSTILALQLRQLGAYIYVTNSFSNVSELGVETSKVDVHESLRWPTFSFMDL